jgi:hypothetical protein
VIPVLWIVLVFQMRVYWPSESGGFLSMEADKRHHKMAWPMALILALTGLLMLFGEWTTIDVLTGHKDPNQETRDLVGTAMFIGAFWVFALPTWPWVETVLDRTPIGRAKFWLWRKLGVGHDWREDEEKKGKKKKGD